MSIPDCRKCISGYVWENGKKITCISGFKPSEKCYDVPWYSDKPTYSEFIICYGELIWRKGEYNKKACYECAQGCSGCLEMRVKHGFADGNDRTIRYNLEQERLKVLQRGDDKYLKQGRLFAE